MNKPLEGIRVLDLSQFISGPYCGMLLHDLGAEVIKLENPPLGDQSRFAPVYCGEASTNYTSRNRGKKSVLMNLKEERQRELFFKLLQSADILISNFRVGAMEKMGLGWEEIKKINPRIVYTMVSGFGQEGSMKDHAAFDGVVQAISGIMSTTGEQGGEPQKIGVSIADFCGGMFACIATLAALRKAKETGEGSKVDVSMTDNLISMQDILIANYFATGKVPAPMGNRHPTAVPNRVFTIKDNEKMVVSCATEGTFPKFCELLGRPDLPENPKFSNMQKRLENHEELEAIIEEILIHWSREEFIEKMDSMHLPYGPINTIRQVVESDLVKEHQLLADAVYPDGQTFRVTNSPFTFSGVEKDTVHRAYPLGYNTFEILKEYADEKTLHEIYDGPMAQCRETAAQKYHKK